MPMTKVEYAAYQQRVADFMAREKLENLTAKMEESYCSSQTCDCCGDSLQGDRQDASGYSRIDNKVKEYVICEDCVYYAEYGRLDDKTMAEIEDDKSEDGLPREITRDGKKYVYSGRIEGHWIYKDEAGDYFKHADGKLSSRASPHIKNIVQRGY